MAETPDLTLQALFGELAGRGVVVSYYTVWHFCDAEGISLKEGLHASEQDRPDVARRRACWQRYQGKLDPARLVFLDGSRHCLGPGPRPT